MTLRELMVERSNNIQKMEEIMTATNNSERGINQSIIDELEILKNRDLELKAQIVELERIENEEKENLKNNNYNKNLKKMKRNLVDLIKENRNGEGFNKINIRAIDHTTGVYDESVAELYSNGEKPLYEQMGVALIKGITEGNVKLPKIAPIVGGKVATGTQFDNDKTLGFVDLSQDERFRITETVSLDMLKQDALIAGLIEEMIKGVDRKIFNEIFVVALAGAKAQSAVKAIDTASFNALEAEVDAENVGFLMPKTVFFTAKSTSVNANSAEYLVKMNGQNQGTTFDGIPVFYSGSMVKQYVFGDLKSIVVGDWGEIEIDVERDAKKGQAYITVAKKACVKYRGVDSLVKTTIA